MLTDAEANEIDAEYQALPGTKPDGYSWAFISELQDLPHWLEDKVREWRQQHGMKWMRLTRRHEDETVWLEVWKERPEKEAPFEPPYMHQV